MGKAVLESQLQWSGYQEAIFDWLKTGSGNLRINAVAGSGKSTVLRELARRLPATDRVAILAFNRHIADSMAAHLPKRINVNTAHGFCCGILNRRFAGSMTINGSKYYKIANEFLNTVDFSDLVEKKLKSRGKSTDAIQSSRDEDSEEGGDVLTREQASRLVRRQAERDLLTLVRGMQSTLTPFSPKGVEDLIRDFQLGIQKSMQERLIPLTGKTLERGEFLAKRDHIVDFNDMLWLVHRWNLQPFQKEWVLVDEAQDVNEAQLDLYRKLGRNARMVFVGDPNQSIMGFAFSSPLAWKQLESDFKPMDLPLSVCYRCPTIHLDLARHYVPQIEARPDAPKGELGFVDARMLCDLVKDGDLVLCRTTKPLIALCLTLMTENKKARVRGRDLGATLSNLIDRVGQRNWGNFAEALRQITAKEIAELQATGQKDAALSLEDRRDSLMVCYESFRPYCEGIEDLKRRVNALFCEEKAPITLSTIHRAKGDESDRVFLLSYPKNLEEDAKPKPNGTWVDAQEQNLVYVSITRARKSLYFCSDPSRPGAS